MVARDLRVKAPASEARGKFLKRNWQISPQSQTWAEATSYAFIQPETIEEEGKTF